MSWSLLDRLRELLGLDVLICPRYVEFSNLAQRIRLESFLHQLVRKTAVAEDGKLSCFFTNLRAHYPEMPQRFWGDFVSVLTKRKLKNALAAVRGHT